MQNLGVQLRTSSITRLTVRDEAVRSEELELEVWCQDTGGHIPYQHKTIVRERTHAYYQTPDTGIRTPQVVQSVRVSRRSSLAT